MYYIGCDQHKHYSQIAVKDQMGTTTDRQKLYHDDRESMKDYFKELPAGSVVALEASGFDPWLCDLLNEVGLTVKLVHPKKTRAIAEERIKTDKLSANVLADLLRANLICEAYQAPTEIRQRRYLGRYRLSLVRLRTGAKNRIHDIVDRLGLQLPKLTDLFGEAGRTYLDNLDLQPVYQRALKGYLELINTLNQLIEPIERELRKSIDENNDILLLKTIPGIGDILANLIWAEIGNIHRFLSSSKLASYVGIIPSLHQSGKKLYTGRITKQGSRYLRWAFVEAAHTAIRKDPYLAQFYNKICHKKGKNVAIVAVAHKLLTYAYWILKEQKPYQPHVIHGRSR